jgi:integrase
MYLFQVSGINQIGRSKHEAKQIARSAGARTWSEIGGKIGVFSFATADAYREVWLQLFRFAKNTYGVKDIEKLKGQHVGAFLRQKIQGEVAFATFAQYTSAVAKLDQALSLFSQGKGISRQDSFSSEIELCRVEAKDLDRFELNRAFDDPLALCEALDNVVYKTAAKMQLQGGARIHEVSLVRYEQLRDKRPDPISGRVKGWFEAQAKGGKIVEIGLAADTYNMLLALIRKNGEFHFDEDAYRRALAKAAQQTGQEYTGSHGLRWCFAQDRMQECQQYGLSYEQALLRVSQEMGHERASITRHYGC